MVAWSLVMLVLCSEVGGRLTCGCLAESPVFTYLKQQQPGFGLPMIKWNFSKFLVDREGRVVKRCVCSHSQTMLLLLLLILFTDMLWSHSSLDKRRFGSVTTPLSISKDVEALL